MAETTAEIQWFADLSVDGRLVTNKFVGNRNLLFPERLRTNHMRATGTFLNGFYQRGRVFLVEGGVVMHRAKGPVAKPMLRQRCSYVLYYINRFYSDASGTIYMRQFK